jgi:hypothetical protein
MLESVGLYHVGPDGQSCAPHLRACPRCQVLSPSPARSAQARSQQITPKSPAISLGCCANSASSTAPGVRKWSPSTAITIPTIRAPNINSRWKTKEAGAGPPPTCARFATSWASAWHSKGTQGHLKPRLPRIHRISDRCWGDYSSGLYFSANPPMDGSEHLYAAILGMFCL